MKRIYIEIESSLHRTQKDVLNEHYIYDFTEKKIKKYNCSEINYKYNFETKKMDVIEQNYKTVKYVAKSNLNQIQSILSRYATASILDSESTNYQVVVDIKDESFEDFVDDLERNNIKYNQ